MSHNIRLAKANLPIVQEITATSTTHGIQTTLILQTRPPTETIKTLVRPNTAYLTTIDPDTKEFPHFDLNTKPVMSMSIEMYIEILNFFKTTWPEIEKEIETTCTKIRTMKAPKTPTENLSVHLEGSCDYQKWFDNIFLSYRKTSHNIYHPHIVLVKEKTKLLLDPNVMKQLAEHHDAVIVALYVRKYFLSSDE